MEDLTKYPNNDHVITDWLRRHKKYWDQAQYSTEDQLLYLIDIANRFGLRDAADWIRKGLDNKLVQKKD